MRLAASWKAVECLECGGLTGWAGFARGEVVDCTILAEGVGAVFREEKFQIRLVQFAERQ